MHTHKNIIIHLIQQDLRHNQLLRGLEKLQLHCGECYELDIRRSIALLMGLPNGRIPDRFLQLYDTLMSECLHLPPDEHPEAFRQLAVYCYEQLYQIVTNNQ